MDKITISWDESGTTVENRLDCKFIFLNDEKTILNTSIDDDRGIIISKRRKFGSPNKNLPSLEIIKFDDSYNQTSLKYVNQIICLLSFTNQKLKFNDLEFLKINVCQDGESHEYEKKINENQDGSVLHYGSFIRIGTNRKWKFIPQANYIKNLKAIKKQFKLKD